MMLPQRQMGRSGTQHSLRGNWADWIRRRERRTISSWVRVLGRPGEVWGAESGMNKLVVLRTQ